MHKSKVEPEVLQKAMYKLVLKYLLKYWCFKFKSILTSSSFFKSNFRLVQNSSDCMQTFSFVTSLYHLYAANFMTDSTLNVLLGGVTEHNGDTSATN